MNNTQQQQQAQQFAQQPAQAPALPASAAKDEVAQVAQLGYN